MFYRGKVGYVYDQRIKVGSVLRLEDPGNGCAIERVAGESVYRLRGDRDDFTRLQQRCRLINIVSDFCHAAKVWPPADIAPATFGNFRWNSKIVTFASAGMHP